MIKLWGRLSCLWRSKQRSAYRHTSGARDGESIPSECCSWIKSAHLRAAYQQISSAAGRERSCSETVSGSHTKISACRHPSGESTPSEWCSWINSAHLRAAYQQISSAAAREGFWSEMVSGSHEKYICLIYPSLFNVITIWLQGW